MRARPIPEATVGRLPVYLRVLLEMAARGGRGAGGRAGGPAGGAAGGGGRGGGAATPPRGRRGGGGGRSGSATWTTSPRPRASTRWTRSPPTPSPTFAGSASTSATTL